MEDKKRRLIKTGQSDIDILNEIYSAMKLLYYGIVRVEPDSGSAVILLSVCAEETGNLLDWEEYLKFYTDHYILPSDRMCVLANFCSENLKRCISQGRRWIACDVSCVSDDGEKKIAISALTTSESPDNRYVYVLVRSAGIDRSLHARNDITAMYMGEDRRREFEKVLKRVQTDPLTRLLNLQATTDRIMGRLSEFGKSYALFLIDIDNFKQINDTFGHPVGDRILRNIADNIVDNSGKNDIVGWVGADEFVFFTEISSVENDVDRIAQKICDAVSSVKISAGFGEGSVTGSVGIAIAPDDGSDYYTLVTKAAQGVDKAKKNGKNKYSF